MIECLNNGIWNSCQTLSEAIRLNMDRTEVISVVGGGGKTTIVRKLQKEYREKKILHVVSTTTHMQYQKERSFLEEESLESFFHVFEQEGTVIMGKPVSQNKMAGISAEFLKKLYKRKVSIILEADGAKYLPVKIPEDHEPVILPESTIVVNVYGMDGLGFPIKEKCFRVKRMTEFLGKTQEDILEGKDLIKLAIDKETGLKGVSSTARYVVVLNKMDLVCDREEIKTIAQNIQKQCGCLVLLTEHLLSE